ncbi:MAG TPA: hypothetical protein VJP77_01810 [Planctomycetota bacterium]|nr:hypothetical protein [Planctomycetota bacterium]
MQSARTAPVASLLLLAACAAPNADEGPFDPTQSTEMVVLADGQVISGRIEARKITVPEGATVRYAGDTTLHAEWICVHGDLLGTTPRADGPPEGVAPAEVQVEPGTLRLVAGREVHVAVGSELHGGDAPSMADWPDTFRGRAAAAGGSVVLDAPYILVDGQVVGGRGGYAAPGGDGGKGGSVWFRDGVQTYNEGPESELVGGAGGMAGDKGPITVVDGVPVPAWEWGTPGPGGDVGPLAADQ